MFKWMVFTIGFVMLASAALAGGVQDVPVLYPKENSIVGSKVNVVLDPTDIDFFQVVVNAVPYPAIATSRGAHAYQGVALEPGLNLITVNVLSPVQDTDKRTAQTVVASRSLKVFNADGAFGPPPAGFNRDPFHTRERELTCAGCHRLEVLQQDRDAARPEDVLCAVCHREMPTGRHIHGPAALWKCLACHDPDLYPAKYAFSSIDPWKVTKYTQTVEPMLFTLSTAGLFNDGSAILLSKDKANEAFADVLEYVRQNPADKVRLEVHTDSKPPRQWKLKNGKRRGFRSNRSLSAARARALSVLLKKAGVGIKNMVVVGMGDKLPKSGNDTAEGRELNNRIEVVVYPADVKVINSRKLPVLKDRDRVVVRLTYSNGPLLGKLRVVDQVPKGMRYVKGSGFLKGRPLETKSVGKELVWEFGDMDPGFDEALYYTLKKGRSAGAVPLTTRVVYRSLNHEQTRVFDTNTPAPRAATIPEICQKCHPGVMDRNFKHGPVESGYCTLCHDPHASPNDAWLRKPVWDLCTTCHPGQGNGVHVVAGYIHGFSHPTKGKRDRARPGKKLSCISCHEPHSGEHQYFFTYGVQDRPDLCKACHKK